MDWTKIGIRRVCASAVCLLAIAVGCGTKGPAVEFVEGTVLLDGQPIEGANVGLSPVGGGLAAYGKTDAAGKFQLTTAQGGRPLGGAPVGEYAVTVSKWRNRLEDLGPEPNLSDAFAYAKYKAEADRLNNLPPDYLVPKAYGDAATSPLKATVKKGRNAGPEFTFELTGDFKPAK